jgi:ATP-binding cassette subfamily B protein/ATP-binding cassette subfamily C protein
VQQGDHDTLMAADGPYRELFELQASGYLAATE